MNKKYMLLLDDYDVVVLERQLDEGLDTAIKEQLKLRILALTELLLQLRHPRALQREPKSTRHIVNEQVLGK